MIKVCFRQLAILAVVCLGLSGCTRDLSSNVYTSDSTLSLTLEGTIIAARAVTIKNSDRPMDATTGLVAGGLAGGVIGNAVGGRRNGVATVGGALAGAALGAVIENKMSQDKGLEYIVKIDMSKFKDGYYEGNTAMRNVISTAKTSGLVTVVQSGKEAALREGQRVYVIFSDNRTRVIPAN